MTRTLFLILTTFPLLAQFSGLATTDDGSQLYFSSTLQLNATENPYAKIFRFDSSGLHFVAQTDKIAVTPGIGTASTNPYNLTSAFVSGNGSVYGYVGVADCFSGVPTCYYTGLEQTTLYYQAAFSPTVLPYGCTISKNAQYAACITGGRVIFEQYGVFDLFGLQKPIYSPPCGQSTGAPHVTSSGTTLCGSTLTSASGTTTLKLPNNTYALYEMISDDGSTVILPLTTPGAIAALNVASGAQNTVYQDPQSRGVLPASVSNNGSVLLFTIASQAAVIHTDGTAFLQLTTEPVTASVLSGDGSTAYVVTASGKLLKFNTATGASTLITSAAVMQQVQGAPVAGSLNTITGQGLADTTVSASTFPLTGSPLGGVQVLMNGANVPILSASPNSVSFQIPWETPAGSASIAVVRPASPFTQMFPPLQIQAVQPTMALSQVISQDFSGFNGAMTPANPGDVVIFYLTGLGPVSVPVADGALSPSQPLSLATNPVTISGAPQFQVAFAGLAPGLVGIYQLSVRIPTAIARNPQFPNASVVEFFLTANSVALPPFWVIPNQ